MSRLPQQRTLIVEPGGSQLTRRFLLVGATATSLAGCLRAAASEPRGQAGARTYFVAPDGNDRRPGTEDAPFATIKRAAEVARAGEVVQVRPGTYVDDIRVEGEGAPSAPISFVASGAVTIVGRIQPARWHGDDSDDPSASGNRYVSFDGFTIETSAPSDDVAVRAATGWRLIGCTIQRTGLGVNIRGNDVTLERCLFQDIDGPRAHAFVGAGSDERLMSNTLVRNCLWQNINLRRLSNCRNSAVHKFLYSRNVTIIGCTARNNYGSGIWMDTNNYGFTISHSTVENNSQYGIQIEKNPGSESAIFNVAARGNGGPDFGTQTGGIALNESEAVEVHHCLCEGNFNASFPIREGSHPVPVARNRFHHNFVNDPHGYNAGRRARQNSPLVSANTMDYDVFGPDCVKSYVLWGTLLARNLAECQAASVELHGRTAATPPIGVGN